MNNVIDISSHIEKREVANTTSLAAYQGPSSDWLTVAETAKSTGLLSANVLRKLDPDSDLGRFFDQTTEAITCIDRCLELLSASQNLAADDEFMASKDAFSHLLMFRDISDSIGLIALRCFQAATQVKAVTDAPHLPRMISTALHRLWAAPFMEFEDACDLADKIESAANGLQLPGHKELTMELISDAETASASQSE